MRKQVEYENIATLILGAWLMLVPLFVNKIQNYRGANVYSWNSFLVGLTVVVMSSIVLKRMFAWAERLNVIAGTWLIVSPLFLIFFNKSDAYFWNAVVCGGAIAFLSALALPTVESVIYHKHKKENERSYLSNPHYSRTPY